jgi:uncharacterized protein YndB with AHSA1/START domain
MLTADYSKASATVVVDHAVHCIRLERRFAAPAEQVFEAWTKPEQVACWWDPSGEALAICEIDLRPGGAFKFVPRANPNMPFVGVYQDIDPPRRLTFEAMGAIGRVLLDADEDATRLRVEIQCRSQEHLKQFLQAGVDEGASRTLDNLVAYVGAQALQ